MNGWTVGDTFALTARAYAWMIGVTVPVLMVGFLVIVTAVALATTGWGSGTDDLFSVVWLLVLTESSTAIAALGGALVSLPFTHVAGRLLRRTRSRVVHVVVTALLAGGLGAVIVAVLGELAIPTSGLVFAPFIGVSAAAAGALARWQQLRAAARRAAASVVADAPGPVWSVPDRTW